MPKAKAKKPQEFQTTMTKSVFLHGKANVEKAKLFREAQQMFTDDTQRFIDLLADEKYIRYFMHGGKKCSEMRALEKENRNPKASATFSQAAFDNAFDKMSNRMDSIRLEMLSLLGSTFVSSKVLFWMSLAHKTKAEMIHELNNVKASYKDKPPQRFDDWIKMLTEMSDKEFLCNVEDVNTFYELTSPSYKIPHVKWDHVRLVSTNEKFFMAGEDGFALEETRNIKADAVISISLPGTEGYTPVPLRTSSYSVDRLRKYGACHSAEYTIDEKGNIDVTVAFKKKPKQPKVKSYVGADVGITDAIHSSEGGPIGTLSTAIGFYRSVVEPLFAERSALRNKKRKLKTYLKYHKNVPEDVRKAIRDKIDRLETMLRRSKKAYRKRNQYLNMLKKTIKDAVRAFIKSLHGDRTKVTALELLDMKEFNKSKAQNGMYSMFARGTLSQKLMETLNWQGYSFVQVEPSYTSQICPVCGNLDEKNRKEKNFKCTCCGYEDDADHVGSINIGRRPTDAEIMAICEANPYSLKERQHQIRVLQLKRNQEWLKANPQIRPKVQAKKAA